MSEFRVVIHHNPECGTSRNVLHIVEQAGYTPTIIKYLETGWGLPQLQTLFAAARLSPRQALRATKSPAAELGLLSETVSDDDILAAMLAHPILVNRPLVASPKGVRLCRPSEIVLDLLERLPPGPLCKEDGSLLIDADGRRYIQATAPALGIFAARPAAASDAEAIAAIYNEGIEDRVATFETSLRTASDIAAWFDGRHPIMVAIDADGTIAAYAASFSYKDRCVYSGIAEFSVYTRRSQRNRGAGRAALLALIEASPSANLWKLVSRVFPENVPSRILLRSLGFREVGVHEKHGQLDGRWRDVILVERSV